MTCSGCTSSTAATLPKPADNTKLLIMPVIHSVRTYQPRKDNATRMHLAAHL